MKSRLPSPALAAGVLLLAGIVLLRPGHDPAPSAARSTPAAKTAPASRPIAVPEAFAAFENWRTRHAETPVSAAQEAEGVELATKRRAAMKDLIRRDPKAALDLALTGPARDSLPPAVSALLEVPIEGSGRLAIDVALPLPGHHLPDGGITRRLVVEGPDGTREFDAHVYGRRTGEVNPVDTGFEGVAIDGSIALYDHGDQPGHEDRCPGCRDLGFGPGAAAWGDTSIGSSDVLHRPSFAWANGQKKVLIIRVDFSDRPGEPPAVPGGPPLTKELAQELFDGPGGIGDFFEENSYGKTSLVTTVSTQLYRMPQTAASYAQGSGNLREAARAAAAADYDLASFDRVGVVCTDQSTLPGSIVTFAGIATLGGQDFLISGHFNFQVVAHELAHTYGVHHANWWKPASGTTLGTTAEMINYRNADGSFITQDYMDPYDIMGGWTVSQDSRHHLNHWFKNLLGWIPDTSVRTVNDSGIYRIQRFDDGSSDPATRTLALKIGRDGNRDYWIGFRRQPFAGSNLATGAYVSFGYNMNRMNDLLDCNTPGGNLNDAALQIGQSLVDSGGGITITPVASGGSGADEYLDIAVDYHPRVRFRQSVFGGDATAGSIAVTVERIGAAGATTVQYGTTNGTALNGVHYTAVSGTLHWPDGDTTPRVITVPLVTPYTAVESSRDFTVQLTNVVNGVIADPTTTTASIRRPGNPAPADLRFLVNHAVNDMDLQPDGKLLMGGVFTLAGSDNGSTIVHPAGRFARFHPDGRRDHSFNAVPGANGTVDSLCVQPDGKVLVGGHFTNIHDASPARPNLARLNADGSLDPTFNPPTFNSGILDLAVQPDGKILATGAFSRVNGAACQGLCRLRPDGSVDFIFNPPDTETGAGLFSVAVDHHSPALGGGRIYAVGPITTKVNPRVRSGVVCLLPDGTPDPAFQIGAGALRALDGSGFVSYENRAVALQADGKLLVGGQFGAFHQSAKPNVVRLNPDGSVDESFTAPQFAWSQGNVLIFTLFAQPDGKVLVGGTFDSVGGVPHRNLVRLTATGAIDPTWDNGTGINNGSAGAVSMMLPKPDGRVLVSPLIGTTIRGVYTSCVELYTGLPADHGRGRFRSASHGALPGKTIRIAVQRVDGGRGAVKIDYATQNESALAGIDYTATAGSLAWADGDTTPKTVSVPSLPGATAGRAFRLNLATPSGGILPGSDPMTRVTISATYDYEIWRAENFDGPAQSADSLSGPEASASADGTPYLLKYALGLAPAEPLQASVHLPSSVTDGRLRFGFLRDPLKTDLIYEVQGSADLLSWTPLARSSAGSVTVNLTAHAVQETAAGSRRAVTVDDAATTADAPGKRYLRLAISR